MIRPIEKKDKEQFLAMLREFYESDAVMAPVPLENHERTFDAIINSKGEVAAGECYITKVDNYTGSLDIKSGDKVTIVKK